MKNRVITKNGIIFLTSATFCAILGSTTFATNNSSVDTVSLEVPVSCTLSKTINTEHQTTMRVGQYEEDIGETSFNVICNDSYGFTIYAVGYSGDQFGNNTMLPANNNVSNAIATGTATSGDNSNWSMKLTSVTDNFSIENSFNNNHAVSNEYQKVASYPSNTTTSTGAEIKSTYSVYISTAQAADTYVGKVKYTVVHPTSALPQAETISQLTYMQDFATLNPDQKALILDSMAYNTTYNLIDNRDNKTYQVARLKDDNIWMTENLDLGRTTLATDLTSANTNLDTNANTVAASDFNTWIKSSGTESYTSAELIPVTGTDSTSNTPYGTLYNYCAASANTVCAEIDTNDNDASSDICPAGWRLPIGGNIIGEFEALGNLNDYKTYNKKRAPVASGGVALALSGVFYDSTPTNQKYYGWYWSSTRYDGSYTYDLMLDRTSVYLINKDPRYYGSAIRCVVKKPSHSLTIAYGTGISDIKVDGKTVQNGETISLEEYKHQIVAIPNPGYGFSSWSATAGQINDTNAKVITYITSENATISATASYVSTEIQNYPSSSCTTTASLVRDNRDDHVYTIQKLADNRCWMMENLDLGRTALITDLTSTNTHLATTVTAETFNSWKKESGTRTFTAGEFISISGADSTSSAMYGTLYNYCAASAGTICADTNNSNASYDICPAGWRLPIGARYGEFMNLYLQYEYNNRMRKSINNNGAAFALAGNFGTGVPDGQGNFGSYWASTRVDDQYMNKLSISTTSVGSLDTSSRIYGYSIRCILGS